MAMLLESFIKNSRRQLDSCLIFEHKNIHEPAASKISQQKAKVLWTMRKDSNGRW